MVHSARSDGSLGVILFDFSGYASACPVLTTGPQNSGLGISYLAILCKLFYVSHMAPVVKHWPNSGTMVRIPLLRTLLAFSIPELV